MATPPIIKKCLVCDKKFRVYPYRKDVAKYCSHKCYATTVYLQKRSKKWHEVMRNHVPWSKEKPWSKEVRRKLSKSQKLRFQREDAWNKGFKGYRAGKKSHLWKGGISKLNRTARQNFMGSFEYRAWRKYIFERDDYTCQICGNRSGKLRANHIKKYADYSELRIKKNNGITICDGCDLRWVMYHEPDWESYFNFNLETRGYI